MRKLSSAEVEFYFGFLTSTLVAFLIPMLVTIGIGNSKMFFTYFYLPIGLSGMIHALYRQGKEER